jgi:hypothetical protein
MFEWINFFDLNNGPIISKIFPPSADENFNPNILNKEKKIIININ